jgi:hypothetical protein
MPSSGSDSAVAVEVEVAAEMGAGVDVPVKVAAVGVEVPSVVVAVSELANATRIECAFIPSLVVVRVTVFCAESRFVTVNVDVEPNAEVHLKYPPSQ